MDANTLALSKNYHLSSCGYLNATQILLNGYKDLDIENSKYHFMQLMPLYYLLHMSMESFLKANLVINGCDIRTLTSRDKGHRLEWLLSEYKKNNKVDMYFESMILAIGKGEYRYTEFFGGGGAYLEKIDETKCLEFLREYGQKNHEVLLKEEQYAKNN